MSDLVGRAWWVAETVLFPDAAGVDRSGEIPEAHFRLLAAEGFYGLVAPPEAGGPGLEFEDIVAVMEALASGCLATTFTWIQHHAAVLGLATSQNIALRERFLEGVVRGTVRSGVAFAGATADPPRLRARKADGGWIFDGDAPFVSGWGIVDVLQISGHAGDTIVNALVDAKGFPAQPFDLVSLQATKTVRLTFDEVFVADERIVRIVPIEEFLGTQHIGARLNGCLATGLAIRSAKLLARYGRGDAAAAIEERIAQVRAALNEGLTEPARIFDARAAAAQLAYHAAAAVVVAEGAPGVIVGGHGQRLVREALFTLVAGSRKPMKDALLTRLTTS